MIQKKLFQISKVILIIVLLNAFAWSVYYVNSGGTRFGVFTKLIKDFSTFPSLVFEVTKEIAHPNRLLPVAPNIESINNLSYDLFAVNGSFHDDRWVIALTNLRNDSTVHEWYLGRKDFIKHETIFSYAPPQLPLILADTSAVFFNTDSHNLFRINSESEVIWEMHDPKYLFHHSLNPGTSDDIWACTRDLVQVPQSNIEYWDDNLTQINLNNGEVLFHKSLSEILIENNLSRLLFGATFEDNDPLHLNDIEPIMSDGTFWKKGDLLLSLRSSSTILLYRPSTNEIIQSIQGPFYFQHDIDVVSDSTISIFNNNASAFPSIGGIGENSTSGYVLTDHSYNRNAEVLLYNFRDSSFTSVYPAQFEKHQIFTINEGLQQVLSNGDLFVESTVQGKVFIFNKDEIKLKKYFNQPSNGLVEFPHWIRLYENLDFLE